MSIKKPSKEVASELNVLFRKYLSEYPEDRPVTSEKYMSFLHKNASNDAYQYAMRTMKTKESIR